MSEASEEFEVNKLEKRGHFSRYKWLYRGYTVIVALFIGVIYFIVSD